MRIYEAKLVYSLVSAGDDICLDKPAKVAEYLHSAFEENPMQEAFYCIYLNRKFCPLGRHLVTLGTVDSTVIAPREALRGAILAGASNLIVAHNHPSGNPAPSQADIRVTRVLREASKAIEIDLIDHIVVGDPKSDPLSRGFFSFKEAGLL